MSLKIIGGTFKNRSIQSPKGPLTKPTTSLLRKAVFDISQGIISDANFLDLFACSGAMGIEAISRGAKHATFVEQDKKTVKTLKENVSLLELEKETSIFCSDVFKFVKSPVLQAPFDIIYIDPPYPLSKDPKQPILHLLQFVETSNLLASSGTLFLEEGPPMTSFNLTRLKLKNSRRFGESILHQFTF